MKTQPTRSFAEYFWSLKTHHGFDPAICLDLGPGQGSAPLHAAFSKALHLSVLPGVELAAPSVPAGLRHEVLHEAALESTGSISDPTPPLKLADLRISSAKKPAAGALPVSTIDALLIRAGAETGPVLIRLDYRGGELRALEGAVQTLKRTELVIIKTAFFPFWGKKHPEFAEVVAFMRDRGFVVHDMLNGLFRPNDRALGVIDLAFVPQDAPLRRRQEWNRT